MAYIRKTRAGTYQAEIFVGRDANGKPIREYITRPTWKECARAAKERELELEERSLMDIPRTRVVAWFEMYLKLNEGEFSPATIALYERYLRNHYTPFFKRMKLCDVNQVHIKQFQAQLLAEKGLAKSSVNRIMSALKAAFGEALGDSSPFKDFKIVGPNEPNVKAPTMEEFLKIWDAVKGSRYELPVLLAAWCGFRRGEILALRVNDLDFENGTIRIDEAWTKTKDGTYVLKPPKSKRGLRTERAPDELMDMLKAYITKAGNLVRIIPCKDMFLFGGRPDTFSTAYRNFIRRHGAPEYSFHELRHFHATWLFENDIPDKYAAKRMGQTIEVLKSTYQHLGLKKQAEVDEKIISIAKAARIR